MTFAAVLWAFLHALRGTSSVLVAREGASTGAPHWHGSNEPSLRAECIVKKVKTILRKKKRTNALRNLLFTLTYCIDYGSHTLGLSQNEFNTAPKYVTPAHGHLRAET